MSRWRQDLQEARDLRNACIDMARDMYLYAHVADRVARDHELTAAEHRAAIEAEEQVRA